MRLSLVLLLTASLAIPVKSARADERTDAAELIYAEARGLMDVGKHAEACPKLEKSLELDEAMGARFLLAECYERLGMLASAWSNYVRVADRAQNENQIERETYARQRAKEIRTRVCTVTLQVHPTTKALTLEISRNGSPIDATLIGAPIPIDPGTHEFQILADGHAPFSGEVTVSGEGKQATLIVPALKPTVSDAAPPVVVEPVADAGTSPLLVSGIIAGAAGVVAMGAGIGVAAAAKGNYDDALAMHCDELGCAPEGIGATEDARSQGTVGSVVFGIGTGIAAAGVVLAIMGITSDDNARAGHGLRVVPLVVSPGGLAMFGGSF